MNQQERSEIIQNRPDYVKLILEGLPLAISIFDKIFGRSKLKQSVEIAKKLAEEFPDDGDVRYLKAELKILFS